MSPNETLKTYLAHYRVGHGDTHDLLWAFHKIREKYGCKRVLYPGCYIHITPSLVFETVYYVDSLKGISKAFAKGDLLEYINQNKSYPDHADIQYFEEDYRSFDKASDFDLLISMNAGLISQACKGALKEGGLLLVNDEHYDASHAYIDTDYQLVGVFDSQSETLETSTEKLSEYFKTKKGQFLTFDMIEANVKKPPSKAPFKPSKRADAYLFRKTS